ncbi:MAG: hypothetical protein V2J26_06180 [Pacificimonas sp.]|nr:hypothetical protein [Pacificimonas sp.]
MLQNHTDRSSFDTAMTLVSEHGEDAVLEAALQADKHRNRGDVGSFVRWRSVERAVLMLQLDDVVGEVH